MSANRWTPGPWTMETVRTSVGVCFKVGPFPWKNGKLNHACIYADYPGPQEHATAEANARLIAAAPELAEACERALRKLEAYVGVCSGDKELTEAILPMLRTALRKARGEA